MNGGIEMSIPVKIQQIHFISHFIENLNNNGNGDFDESFFNLSIIWGENPYDYDLLIPINYIKNHL